MKNIVLAFIIIAFLAIVGYGLSALAKLFS